MDNDSDKGKRPAQPAGGMMPGMPAHGMPGSTMPGPTMPGPMMPGAMMPGPSGMGAMPMGQTPSNAAGSEMMISADEIAELAMRADAAAELLRTLANRNRIMILCHLAIKERSVTELAGLVGMNLSTLSLHLGRLRRDQLVLTRRVSHQVFYRIGEGSVREIMTVLYHVYCRKVEAINQGRMMAEAAPMTPMMSGGTMPGPMMRNPAAPRSDEETS
jgi:DNA-binding transcriptional ArsR family regulator